MEIAGGLMGYARMHEKREAGSIEKVTAGFYFYLFSVGKTPFRSLAPSSLSLGPKASNPQVLFMAGRIAAGKRSVISQIKNRRSKATQTSSVRIGKPDVSISATAWAREALNFCMMKAISLSFCSALSLATLR